jgi:charged multivesicular body protein 6
VEFARIEQSVLHGLKQGNEVLARIHEEMSIENVEKLMSETREAIAYQQASSFSSPHFWSLTK